MTGVNINEDSLNIGQWVGMEWEDMNLSMCNCRDDEYQDMDFEALISVHNYTALASADEGHGGEDQRETGTGGQAGVPGFVARRKDLYSVMKGSSVTLLTHGFYLYFVAPD